jgi:hypothetical protein
MVDGCNCLKINRVYEKTFGVKGEGINGVSG